MTDGWHRVNKVWYSPSEEGCECIAVERALVVQPQGWADLEGVGPTRDAAVAALRAVLADTAGEDPCPY